MLSVSAFLDRKTGRCRAQAPARPTTQTQKKFYKINKMAHSRLRLIVVYVSDVFKYIIKQLLLNVIRLSFASADNIDLGLNNSCYYIHKVWI